MRSEFRVTQSLTEKSQSYTELTKVTLCNYEVLRISPVDVFLLNLKKKS